MLLQRMGAILLEELVVLLEGEVPLLPYLALLVSLLTPSMPSFVRDQ